MKNQSTSTIDLIVLGFLLDKAMNAYELANLIIEKKVGHLLKISPPSVYKSCKRLCDKGFIDGEMVKKSEQPGKTVYKINKTGTRRFYYLMEHFSSNFAPFFLDCNAFIWNIEKLEKEKGLKMLKNLHDKLLDIQKWIAQHEKEEFENMSFASRAIVKQYRMLSLALVNWSKEVSKDYNKIK